MSVHDHMPAALADVFDLVLNLPSSAWDELALGPLEEGCRACVALEPWRTAPIHATPANILSAWHSECVVHRPGRGWEQDATRAGAMYGIAVALLREAQRRDAEATASSTKDGRDA